MDACSFKLLLSEFTLEINDLFLLLIKLFVFEIDLLAQFT